MPMNAEVKARWIMALRSGAYEQTYGNLHNTHGFCCLGVLADIEGCVWADRNGRYRPFLEGISENIPLSMPGDPGDDFLSEDFLQEVGLDDDKQRYLANLNDDRNHGGKHKYTFTHIADYIEHNLL